MQRVLSRKAVGTKIYERPEMIELDEYVRYQGWLHLFE